MNLDVEHSAAELRALAAWHHEYAEAAGNPAIWCRRLGMAEDLEQRASSFELRARGLE
jgi:hypothetical protein